MTMKDILLLGSMMANASQEVVFHTTVDLPPPDIRFLSAGLKKAPKVIKDRSKVKAARKQRRTT